MKTFDMDNPTWGDHIQWWPDFASRKVTGWKAHRPVKGDRLRVSMKSGKVLLCEFIEVEHMQDPEDMFFGTVRDIGYEGEPPFPRWPRLHRAWRAVKSLFWTEGTP